MGLQIAGTDAAPQVRWTVPLCKQVETATGLKVFGWGSVSVEADGALQVDHHRDIIEPEFLEPAVYAFTKAARAVDSDHDFEAKGGLIESLFWSPEKAAAMGVAPGDSTPRVAWWVGFEVEDPATIARVKSGELGAFSIAYFADRVELPDDQRFKARIAGVKASHPNDPARPIGRLRNLRLPILSLVTEGASKGAHVVLFKARTPGAITGAKEAHTMDLDAIMAKLTPEEQAVIKDAIAKAAAAAAPKAEEPKPPEQTPAEKALADERAQLKARVAELEAAQETASIKAALVKDGLEFVPGLDLDTYAKTRRVGLKANKADSDHVHAALVKAAAAIKASNVMRTHGAGTRDGDGAGSWDELYTKAKDDALAKDPKADLGALARDLAAKHKDLYLAR